MLGFIATIFCFVFIAWGSFAAGQDSTERKLRDLCIKNNPTIEVGKIDAYCNERLYLKD